MVKIIRNFTDKLNILKNSSINKCLSLQGIKDCFILEPTFIYKYFGLYLYVEAEFMHKLRLQISDFLMPLWQFLGQEIIYFSTWKLFLLLHLLSTSIFYPLPLVWYNYNMNTNSYLKRGLIVTWSVVNLALMELNPKMLNCFYCHLNRNKTNTVKKGTIKQQTCKMQQEA